jgi:hypothetical protein
MGEAFTDEANVVVRIRDACLVAKVAAEIVATDSENMEAARAYQIAKQKCVAVAVGISDSFYRDTAFHFIYVLCQRANDTAAAQSILDRITTSEILGNILDKRPALFD